MELRQLEYLVAVAEQANFTRAAAAVHVSQPGLSAQVRALEHELGAELFHRSARSSTLTAAGQAALPHARAALSAVAALRGAVDETAGVLRGTLAVGMVVGCTIGPLFAALAAFAQARPGVEMSLSEQNSDTLLEAVRAGRVDVALAATSGPPPQDLTAATVIEDPLLACVPPGHRLAARRRVGVRDLAPERLVSLPDGTGVRDAFRQTCAEHGVPADIGLVASAPDAVADLAVRGLGVAVLSATMASDHADRLVAVPLIGRVRVHLSLVARRRPSPAAAEFLAAARTEFGLRGSSGRL